MLAKLYILKVYKLKMLEKILKKFAFFGIYLVIFTYIAYAARPMNTDDARVVPYGHCQLETWSEFHFAQNSEIWALPACNLFFDTEISLGGDIGFESSALRFQIKKLFVNADEKPWGIGIAIGNALRHTDPIHYNFDDFYFYVPASVVLLDSRLVFHLNIGYNWQSLRHHLFTAGLGMEAELTDRIFFIGEIYYTLGDPLIYQIGLRTWLIPDMLQMDSTFGSSVDSRDMFVSVGFRIISPRLRG